MTDELQAKVSSSEIRILDDKIDEVAEKMAGKMEINIEKAETELKMGVVMAMMMNRHKVQEMKEK